MSGMKASNPRRSQPAKAAGGGDCGSIRFRIDLMGVRSLSAKKVRVGDLLEVLILTDGPMRAVVCRTEAGEIVGALSAFQGLAQLIDCLNQGVPFSALVEKSSDQSCSVFVSRATP